MTNQSDNEINLLELSINLFLFFKRRLILIITITILGGILGLVKYYISNPSYDSFFIARSEVTDKYFDGSYSNIKQDSYDHSNINSIAIDLINSLNILISKRNLEELSDNLNITESSTINILSISTEPVYENKLESKINRFKVYFKVSNINLIDSIENGLKHFIHTNQYFNKEMGILRNQTKELITKIDNEIQELDSFQNSVYGDMIISNKVIDKDKVSSHSEIIELYTRKQYYEKLYKSADPFRIIKKSYIPIRRTNTLTKAVISFCSIFVFIGLFTSFLIDLKIKIVKQLQSRK